MDSGGEGLPDEGQTPSDNRANELKDRKVKIAELHEGNRVSAEPDEPQPTREPTPDRRQ